MSRPIRFTRRTPWWRGWGDPRPLAWLDAGSTPFWYCVAVALVVGVMVWIGWR